MHSFHLNLVLQKIILLIEKSVGNKKGRVNLEDGVVKIRLKAHESFYIREGWLRKGIKNVHNDCRVFINEDATDVLGA